VEPTSERIVQDILDLPRVLEKIVEANGCVVHGEALRNGHRARRLDGKGILKTPLRASNRKETLVGRPVHPDAKVAYDNIMGVQENLDNLNIVLDTIEEVENLIDDTNIEIERDQHIHDSYTNELNTDFNEV